MKWKTNIAINNSKIIIHKYVNYHHTTVSNTSNESVEECLEDRSKTVKEMFMSTKEDVHVNKGTKAPMSTKAQTIEQHSIPQSQEANRILNGKQNDTAGVYVTMDRPGPSRGRLLTRLRSPDESLDELQTSNIESNGEPKNGEDRNAAFVGTLKETGTFEGNRVAKRCKYAENDYSMQSSIEKKKTKVNGGSSRSHHPRKTQEIDEEDAVVPVETGPKKAHTITLEKRYWADQGKNEECSSRKKTSECILDEPVPSTSADLPDYGLQSPYNYLLSVDGSDSGSDTVLLPVPSASLDDTTITTQQTPTIPSTNDEKVYRKGRVQEWIEKNSQQTAAKKSTNRSSEMIELTDLDDDETRLPKVPQTKKNNLERIKPMIKANEQKKKADNDSIDSEYSYKSKKIWERMYGPITVEDRTRRTQLRLEKNFCPKREKLPTQREFSQELLDALHHDLVHYENLHIMPNKIIVDLAMLHYFICRPRDIRICGGLSVFKTMLDTKWKVLQGKTAFGLHSRFNDYVRGYVDQFGLPQSILDEFLFREYMKNLKWKENAKY